MWFAGAFVGLLLGALVGGFSGAMAGLLIGLFGGLWLSTLLKRSEDDQTTSRQGASAGIDENFKHIYKALEDIHWRLERIEKRESLKASPMGQTQATNKEAVAASPRPSVEVSTPMPAAVPNQASATQPMASPAMPAIAVASAAAATKAADSLDVALDVVPPAVPLVVSPAAPETATAALQKADAELVASIAALSATADGLAARVAAADIAAPPVPPAPAELSTQALDNALTMALNAQAKPDAKVAAAMEANVPPMVPSTATGGNRDIKVPDYPQERQTRRPSSPPRTPPSTPPPPVSPPADEGPNFFERMLSGNIVAKIGVIILFFGVGFLLKLAYDRGMFPPSMRLLAVAAAAGAMLFIGWKLLEKNRNFALILLGGAMGLLYVDVFFALKTFALLNPIAAFGLFFAIGVAMTLMAVKMDAKVLAVLGLIGAFMAPILASTGGGNHVLLFSYYLLLNGFILAVSWFKSWRELNLTGFIFTFAIALLWGNNSYQPENFNTVEPFLIAFFVLYVAIPILFAHRQPPELKGLVDGTLIFGTPLSCAMMQAALTRGMGDHVLAWSAAGAAALYGLLALIFWRRQNMKLLAEAHLALGIVFATVAPYFAFNSYPTFAFWTLEGAAIFWLGCRQSRLLARCFGLLLQFGAAGYFLWHFDWSAPNRPWLNDYTVGAALIALSSWITAWFMRRFVDVLRTWESASEGAMIGWGALWWLSVGAYAIHFQWPDAHFPHSTTAMAMLLFATLSFALWELSGSVLHWSKLRLICIAHVALIAVLGYVQFQSGDTHPLADIGAIAWPLTFAVLFFTLHRQARDGVAKGDFRYAAAWGLMIVLATWEAIWRYQHQQFAWVWAIAIVGFVAAGLRYKLREVLAEDHAEKIGGSMSISALALLWALFWWFTAAHGYVEQAVAASQYVPVMLTYAALSVLAFEFIGTALGWLDLRRAQWLLPLAMAALAARLAALGGHPGEGWGIGAWLLAFAVTHGVMWRQTREQAGNLSGTVGVQQLFTFIAAFVLLSWEGAWRYQHQQFVWVSVIAALGFIAAWLRFAKFESAATGTGNGADAGTNALTVSALALVWGGFWWFAAAHGYAEANFPRSDYLPIMLTYTALSVLAAEFIGAMLGWANLRRAQWLLPLAMLAGGGVLMLRHGHPGESFGLIAWALAFAVSYVVMWRQENQENTKPHAALDLQHLLTFWGVFAILAWESHWLADERGLVLAWKYAAFGVLLAIAIRTVSLLLAPAYKLNGEGLAGIARWPVRGREASFVVLALAPFLAMALVWTLVANFTTPGHTPPLPYLPILNAIDITQLLLFAASYFALRAIAQGESAKVCNVILAIAGFIWINGVLLRTVHHWADVPFEWHALMGSVVVQAAFSILWTLTAMPLMWLAGRKGSRALWGAGAMLLCVVVAKLLFYDLYNTDTVARVVSFLGVGVLLLVIGYVAPIPPGATSEEAAK